MITVTQPAEIGFGKKEPMPTKETKDWKLSVILVLLSVMGIGGVGGGLPYISELQHKADITKEATIRLEEQLKAQKTQMDSTNQRLLERLESLEKEIKELRVKMEARGVVNKIANGSPIAGDRHTEE